MQLTSKQKYYIAGTAVIVAFAAGRYSTPEKIKTEIKTVEVEKKDDKTVTKTDNNTHKKVVIVKTTKPDGETSTTITKTDDSTQTDDTRKVDDTQVTASTDQTKEVTKQGGTLRLSLLGGAHVLSSSSSSTLVYGISASKNILGPISCGLWGFNDGTIGASIGIDL